MRTYVIDQLKEADIAAITARLLTLELQAGVEGVYWLPVPCELLTETRMEHREQCGPYCLALEVCPDAVHLELLVRGMGRISCGCISFASEALRNHMIKYLEDMLKDLNITF